MMAHTALGCPWCPGGRCVAERLAAWTTGDRRGGVILVEADRASGCLRAGGLHRDRGGEGHRLARPTATAVPTGSPPGWVGLETVRLVVVLARVTGCVRLAELPWKLVSPL